MENEEKKLRKHDLDLNAEIKVTPTTCTNCGENKIRISTGKTSPNGTRRYYVDEHGKIWRGKNCPRCSRMKHTKHARKARGTKVPFKYRDDMF